MIKPEVVNKLNSIHELLLLMYLSSLDKWIHTKESRKSIADKLQVAEITVKVALRDLKSKGFIYKISRGVYKVDKDRVT